MATQQQSRRAAKGAIRESTIGHTSQKNEMDCWLEKKIPFAAFAHSLMTLVRRACEPYLIS